MTERDLPYQPYYCEENVWKLLRGDYLGGDRRFAVVISNRVGACPVWNQRAAPSPERPVFWDYHVVAAAVGGGARIWDLDSRLEPPVDLDTWLAESFPGIDRLPRRFHPSFRVVPEETYLEVFSSNRAHMRDEAGGWKKPPPDWPAIYQPERGMNLDQFVDMDLEFVGEVCTRSELAERLDRG